MKIETKEKIEIFKQVVQGLFTLLIGVSILLAAISLYNHFKSPEVGDKPKEPEVSECDCENYVKEHLKYFGDKEINTSYKWCDYKLSGYEVKGLVLGGGIDASERVKDCDQ